MLFLFRVWSRAFRITTAVSGAVISTPPVRGLLEVVGEADGISVPTPLKQALHHNVEIVLSLCRKIWKNQRLLLSENGKFRGFS